MYEKALKWLQDTLHFWPNADLFQPPPAKRHHHKNDHQQNSFFYLPPCDTNSTYSQTDDDNKLNGSSIPWSRRLVVGNHRSSYFPPPYAPANQQLRTTGNRPPTFPSFDNLPPPCSGLHRINASSGWSNLSSLQQQLHEKLSVQGKWLGGVGGRSSWTPPGLEAGGEDGAGTNDVTNSWTEDNVTGPDYGFYNYNYDYDFDQSDWLTSHLDELYEIMRASQIDTNIALTVFLVAVFLFGVTGNILVLAVFSRGAAQQQASTVFIKALAVTDLVICLVVLPGVLLKEWYIPYRWDALCQGWELIRCSTIPLSTLILASVAVDRYVKICRVDRSIQISTAAAKKILLATATISVCLGIPPMLRMGVYQAGDGPDAPKIYLGLCMGNDLLVSKETVDRYWQAMAAKFLLVLLVVMVMYGLVFRTVYRQSRRWGRCAAKPSQYQQQSCGSGGGKARGGGGAVTKGWFNKGYDDRNEEDNVVDDGDCCQEERDSNNQTSPGEICDDEQAIGCCGSYSQNGDGDVCDGKCRKDEMENVKHRCGRSNANGGRCSRSTNHKMRKMVETVQIEKKKSSLSLSFLLCSSKRNSDVIENPPKIPCKKQDELQDDGVTSLDDGHMSYLNNPSGSSSSSQRQTEENNKKKPLSAIFSCTSQLTVSRRAYVQKKSYYQSEAGVGEEDEDYVEEKNTKLKKGMAFMPHWLRRWKRLITVALFTTAAQRDEEQRSAVKLALRQKAKIKMMNQEASCDIEANTMTSQQPPDSEIANRSKDSTTETTAITRLSSSNPPTVITDTTETNWNIKNKRRKKWSQSLDFEISNPNQEMERKTREWPSEVRRKNETETHHNNEHGVTSFILKSGIGAIIQKKKDGNAHHTSTIHNPNTRSAVLLPTLDTEGNQDVNANTHGQAVSYPMQQRPSENNDHQERFVTINRDDLTGKQQVLFASTTLNNSPSVVLQEYNSFNTTESSGNQAMQNTQIGDRNDKTPDQGPFQAWINQHKTHHRTHNDQPQAHDEFQREHKAVINTASLPLSTKTGHKSTNEIRGSGGIVGANKVHPLNSPLFYYSVPNTTMTHTSNLNELREKNSENHHKMSAADQRWIFGQSKYRDMSNNMEANCVSLDTDKHQRDCVDSDNDEVFLASNSKEKHAVEFAIVKDSSSELESTNADNKSLTHPSNQARWVKARKENGGKRNPKHCQNEKCPRRRYQKPNQKNNNGRLVTGIASKKDKVGGADTGVRRIKTPPRRYNGAQVKTAQVLFLVTVVYVLSFAPVLLMSVEAVPPHPIPFYGYFIHSAANPILYSFINEAFRSQLYNLLCPRCGKKK